MEADHDSEKAGLLDKHRTLSTQQSYSSLGSIEDDVSSTEDDEPKGCVQRDGHTNGGSDSAQHTVRLYYRRYYILVVFSLVALVQGLLWNTWSPISQSAKRVYGWKDGDIALLANWGPITYVLTMLLFSWLIDSKGLRVSCLMCSVLLAGGSGVRCITQRQPYANWLIHSGQIMAGLAGPVAMAGCTVISSVWFPPNERTTATSIGAMSNLFGVAVSFLIGPLLVPQHHIGCNMTAVYNSTNSSAVSPFSDAGDNSVGICGNTSMVTDILLHERRDVMKLQYIEFGIAGTVFLAVLLYFPAKPPHPPSITASVNRADFKAGLMRIVKNGPFWLISSVYGICIGIENTWLSILDINFNPLGVTQDEAGWMGFYSILAGTVGALVVARFADIFAKHLKAYIVILLTCSLAAFTWIALMFIHVAPFAIEYLYIAVVFGGFCLNSSVPLLYELSCEITFPVSEGVTSGALTLYFNSAALVFLSVMMIPNIGYSWTNWSVPGTIALCIPLLMAVREKYNRLNIDIEVYQSTKSKSIQEIN